MSNARTRRPWTVGRKLYFGLLSQAVVFVLVAGGGLWSTRHIDATLENTVDVAAKGNTEAGRILFNESDLSAMTRLAVIAAARHDRTTVDAMVKESRGQLSELNGQLEEMGASDNPNVKSAASDFKKLMVLWGEQAEKTWTAAEALDFTAAATAENGLKAYNEKAEELATRIFDAEVEEMSQRKAEGSSLVATSQFILAGGLIIAAMVMAGFVFVIRGINGTLGRAGVMLRAMFGSVPVVDVVEIATLKAGWPLAFLALGALTEWLSVRADAGRLRIPPALRPVGVALLAALAVYLRGPGNAFIYFQF